MKRSIIILLIVSLITAAFPMCAYSAVAEDFIKGDVLFAFLDGAKVGIYEKNPEIIDSPVYIENEKMMLPANYIFSHLGYELAAEGETFTASGKNKVVLTKDSAEISFDEEKITLSANTAVKNDSFFVSEEILEKLGYVYSKDSNVLVVSKNNKPVDFKAKDLKPIFGIYVSPYSKKTSGGTPDEPVALSALVQMTESAVKKYGTTLPTFVFLMGGEYKHYTTLDFSSATFSSDTHKTIYIEAYGDSQPVLSGSVDLDINELQPVTDAVILARLPKAGRGNVAYLDLKKYNIPLQDLSGFFHYVYLDDMKQSLSRWPNSGFTKVKSVPQANTFGFSEIEPTTWTKAKSGKIYGFFNSDYDCLPADIISVDPVNKLINGPNFKTTRAGARYYAVNMLEVIDMPGEWFVDIDEEILYYYPPYSLKESRLEIAATPGVDMVNLQDARNITFRGIHFTKAGGRAIFARTPRNIEVRECDFSFIQGVQAIRFDQYSYDCIIDANTIYASEGSLLFIRSGRTSTGVAGNCVVSNNHCIASNTYPRGISGMIMGGYNSPERNGSVGLTITNNVFQDCSNSYSISTPGEDVKVYYNEVMNQSRNVDDGGAIYFGKSHSYQGIEVMFNYVHDLNKEHSYCAYYNDDGQAGVKWMYNVSKDVTTQSITGLGADFNMSFNLAINNVRGVGLGSRMTWGADTYGDEGSLYKEVVKVLESDYGAEYLKKYPHVAEYPTRKPYSAPYNAIAYGNVGVNTRGKAVNSYPQDEYKYFAKEFTYDGKTIDITKTNATPEGNPHFDYSDDYFVDPENQNFSIKPDSEIAKAVPEILKIDMTKIGIQEDKLDSVFRIPEDGFRLRAPMNGEGSVQTKNTLFSWDQVRGASKYRVMIATDKEMTNLVYDNTVWEMNSDNHVNVDTLSLNTVYYWQVEAIGISRQKPFTVKSVGPFAFRTARKNELSKDGLKLAIEAGTKFFQGLEGDEGYKYDEKFLNEFKALLDKSNTAYKSSSLQEEIDSLEEELYIMVGKSPYFQYLHYDHLDVFREDQEWTHGRETAGRRVNADGTVTFYTDAGTASRADVNTKNSVLCFKIKFDELTEGGYRGVYFKYDKNGKGYLVVVKPTILEFQGVNQTLFELPNFEIKAGEWYEMQVGGINTPGGVLQFWKINGKTAYARLDTTGGQTRDEGRIWVQHREPETHFMKVDTLPEDQTIYDALLKEFNTPECEDHLEWLLIGAGDAVEMNTTFYNVADKNEMARILYPRVQSKEIQIFDDGDVSAYKKAVTEALILTGYNTGLEDYLFQNRVHTYFNDVIAFEKIDENGVNLYDFYKNRLKDLDRIEIHTNSMNKNLSSIEELRKEFARQILTTSINACGRTFANENGYYTTILTKENADYLGINIDKYLALSADGKDAVNAVVHASSKEGSTTLDEIVKLINDTASGL